MILTKDADIEAIRKAGRLAGQVLEELAKLVAPGITTFELDVFAERAIRDGGGLPTFKGYRNFPATICASVNEEVVHGIPSKNKVLKEGDVISIDIGVTIRREVDFIGDTAVTVPVGRISPKLQKLLDDTQQALYAGIKACRGGQRLNLRDKTIEGKVFNALPKDLRKDLTGKEEPVPPEQILSTDNLRVIFLEAARFNRLSEELRKSLNAGCGDLLPEGANLDDIGGAIEDIARPNAYGLVRDYGGHGIGPNFHEDPFIFNYRTGSRIKLKPGMVVAIEPMFNQGGDRVKTKPDGWTVVTQDYRPSAHFEHSLLITEREPEVLTRRPNEAIG